MSKVVERIVARLIGEKCEEDVGWWGADLGEHDPPAQKILLGDEPTDEFGKRIRKRVSPKGPPPGS